MDSGLKCVPRQLRSGAERQVAAAVHAVLGQMLDICGLKLHRGLPRSSWLTGARSALGARRLCTGRHKLDESKRAHLEASGLRRRRFARIQNGVVARRQEFNAEEAAFRALCFQGIPQRYEEEIKQVLWSMKCSVERITYVQRDEAKNRVVVMFDTKYDA